MNNFIALFHQRLEEIDVLLHIHSGGLRQNLLLPVYPVNFIRIHIDAVPAARAGFAGAFADYALTVVCPPALHAKFPADRWPALHGVLAQDPRPSYQTDPARVYGLRFAGFNIRFTVDGSVLTVCAIEAER